MTKNAPLIGLICLLIAAPALAQEIGPRQLAARTTVVRNNLRNLHEGILREARNNVGGNSRVRLNRDRTFAELVGRYVPGAEELSGGAGVPIDRARLSRSESNMLENYAEQMAGAAQLLWSSGLGGEAGAEAYLALGLDPSNAKAGAILGYQASGGAWMHPMAASLGNRRMALTSFGWLPYIQAQQQQRGFAPDLGMWQPAGVVDARHASWPTRHVFTYTLVQIETSLGLSEVEPWARDVDELVAWMRARFMGIPGYREPAWPLVVRIYRNQGECRIGGDQPPQQGAVWTNVGVIDNSVVTRNRFPLKNLTQMLLAEGFLDSAFRQGRRGTVLSGWMDGGFGKWSYYADSATPNRTALIESALGSLSGVLRELTLGRDLFGQLRDMSYEQGRSSEYARVAPLLIEMCSTDPLAWEGIARFISKVEGATEQRRDFEEDLGPSATVSAALGNYARGLSGNATPGGGGGTPEVEGTKTLTVGEAFLRHLGVDGTALAEAIGVPKARQISKDVLLAYLQNETSAGRHGRGLRFTLNEVPNKSEWTVELYGRPRAVQAFIDSILWQAGLRPPPKNAPPPSPAPGGDHGGPGIPSSPWNVDPGSATDPGPRVFDRSVSNYARTLYRGSQQVTAQHLAAIDRGDAAAVSVLLDLLRQGSKETRSSTTLVLGKVGGADARVLPALSGALQDSETVVRMNALEGLRTMEPKPSQAVPDIASVMVSDRQWEVRQKAADTLETMPPEALKGVLPTLLTGLHDSDARVRSSVVKVLGNVAEAYPDTRTTIRMAILRSGGADGLLNELLKRLGD